MGESKEKTISSVPTDGEVGVSLGVFEERRREED